MFKSPSSKKFVAVRRLAQALGFMILGLITPCQAQSDREQEIAAAMIYNFARFTQWPEEALGESDSFEICVSSAAPILSALRALESRTVKNKKVRIQYIEVGRPDGVCHIELISVAAQSAPPRRGTLYVALEEGLASDMATLELIRVGRQTRFSANPAMAKRAGLQLSSKLVDLAIKIR